MVTRNSNAELTNIDDGILLTGTFRAVDESARVCLCYEPTRFGCRASARSSCRGKRSGTLFSDFLRVAYGRVSTHGYPLRCGDKYGPTALGERGYSHRLRSSGCEAEAGRGIGYLRVVMNQKEGLKLN